MSMEDRIDRVSCVAFLAIGFVLGLFAASWMYDRTADDFYQPPCDARAYSMYDFNLAPYDYEGNFVTNPAADVFRSGSGVPLVAVMLNPYTGEPFHFQAIDEDTRLSELDMEFSACKRLFEYDDRERVVDVFEKIKTKR